MSAKTIRLTFDGIGAGFVRVNGEATQVEPRISVLLRRIGPVLVSRRNFKGAHRLRLERTRRKGHLDEVLEGRAAGIRLWLCIKKMKAIFGVIPTVLYWRKEKP